MRSLTWVRNVGPRCLGKKNYQNLSGSCNKTHTKKAERETKGERGVNLDTFVHKVLMTTNNSNYFKLILSDVSK